MNLLEYLAVPFILTMEPARGSDGSWICRAEYPELPGCVGEAVSPIEAIDRLELAREQYIVERFRRGAPIPVPRHPLAYWIPLVRARASSGMTAR